jgi:glycine hydroxymethyltransferase
MLTRTLSDDPQLKEIIEKERTRQNSNLDLIASQSLAPLSVMEASGSILTNRTIEGYPGKRYYAGGQFLDEMENLARDRAKALFNAEHANVQPHCGANTNLATYLAVLEPGDTILGMDLASGGHLSHGHPLNVASKLYKFVHYGVNRETGTIDYDQARELAREYRPKMIVGGASSYPREVDWSKLKEIADEVSALLLADVAHTIGFVAAGIHDNPVKYADFVNFSLYKTLPGPRGGCILCREKYAAQVDRAIFPGVQGSMMPNMMAAKANCFKIAGTQEFKDLARQVVKNSSVLASVLSEKGFEIVTGGTESHIVVVDVRNRGINGRDAEKALERTGLIVNRNVVPFDPEKPWITSGIRIGTTVASMRGMKEEQMKIIANIIARCLDDTDSDSLHDELGEEVKTLCQEFPLGYGSI